MSDAEGRAKENAMLESAKFLLETAIKAQMEIHKIDRETATQWIQAACELC